MTFSPNKQQLNNKSEDNPPKLFTMRINNVTRAEEDRGQVSVPTESEEQARQRSKNTLIATLSVLAKQGMYSLETSPSKKTGRLEQHWEIH